MALSPFQSTHPHGVRQSDGNGEDSRSGSFNPRTRTGCDHLALTVRPLSLSFNPRTRTGCDCRVFKPALGADQKRSLREPHFLGRFFCYVFVKNRRIRLLEPGANLPGISCSLGVRAKIYIVNIPSGSYVSLAPTCSTLRFQLLPKK